LDGVHDVGAWPGDRYKELRADVSWGLLSMELMPL
jgi:hypothetical protein